MSVPKRYLELALRLGKHVEGLVESYYGPPELGERVDAEEPLPPDRLAAEATALLGDVAEAQLEPDRQRWLEAQVRALDTTARRLAGEPFAYPDEVELCYGIRPQRVPEGEFEAAHRLLDAALPGDGELADRYAAWLASTEVSGERLRAAIESLLPDLRTRAAALVGLPEGEEVELEFVSNKPWTAFSGYLGGFRSRISFNTDLPLRAPDLARLIAHEIYPGHHTHDSSRELALVRERGRIEETLVLSVSPSSVIAEGVAELAYESVCPDDAPDLALEHLRPLGISYDPRVAEAVRDAAKRLYGVRLNVAWMLHDGAAPDEACAYQQRWSLEPPDRVEQTIRRLGNPRSRGYIQCYSAGYELCRRYVRGDPERFRRLLTEQLVPDDLRAA